MAWIACTQSGTCEPVGHENPTSMHMHSTCEGEQFILIFFFLRYFFLAQERRAFNKQLYTDEYSYE